MVTTSTSARGVRCLLLCVSLSLAQTLPTVFVSNTDLQSIAVRVADKRGHDVHGLTASDFTILEDGRSQQIAFFGAEKVTRTAAPRLSARCV